MVKLKRREILFAAPAAILLSRHALAASPSSGSKGVMLMNRIAPSSSELYIANADGSGERRFLESSAFDYNASWSRDGKWVVFTSERNGDGQSDIFRCRADGSGIEPLVTGPSVDDTGVLSPDGSRLAFVSTRDGFRANIWTLDLKTGAFRRITGGPDPGDMPDAPNCYFRPSWSLDGEWLAFSSDRNTPWRGHDEGRGWEHTQELSIYVSRPDGSGFKQIAAKPGYCLGSPKWSPDGKRIVFYEITTEGTWGAHRPEWIGRVASQIVSVDVATNGRVEHTSGPGLKVAPSFLSQQEIAYLIKGGADEGLAFTSTQAPPVKRQLRSPAWSPDSKFVIYEKTSFRPVRPLGKPLYSWDKDWDYRHIDVFPALSSKTGELVFTEKQLGNSSLIIMNPDGSNRRKIYDPAEHGIDPELLAKGLSGAFQPAWSRDAEWIAFGVGAWFFTRRTGKATVMRVRRDGSNLEALTDGSVNSGFPSYSADSNKIVYRVWGENQFGLRILDLRSRETHVLTTEADNLPHWSPDGERIVFTRRVSVSNWDVFTIRPDGTNLKQLTTAGANDGHAVWTADGRILWNSGMYGFRDEAALYDNTFQPYGQILIMNADGSNKRMLTDSRWEDSMPLYIPAKELRHS